MKFPRWIRAAVILAIFACTFRTAQVLMVAKALAAPHATAFQIVRSAVSPKYEMAVPHRSVLSSLTLGLVPSAKACGNPGDPCDGSVPHSQCYAPCQLQGCHCPTCNYPCTVWTCVPGTGAHKLCGQMTNSDPTCEIPCPDAGPVSCISGTK
jgi:hypothetical protein